MSYCILVAFVSSKCSSVTIHVLAELCYGYCQWEEVHARRLETIDSCNNDWIRRGSSRSTNVMMR